MTDKPVLLDPDKLKGLGRVVSKLDAVAAVEAVRQDIEDKRTLRGKYAPKTGVCRVCKGNVVAETGYRDGPFGPKIGGAPPQHRVLGWHCEGCKLVYKSCPPEAP